MALKHTFKEARRNGGRMVSKILWAILEDLDDRVSDAEAGVVAEGSISTDELANGAVTESKLGTGVVTSGKLGTSAVTTIKINDAAVTPDKLFDNCIDSAGVTTAALTTAIAAPATLVDGTVYIIKDTSDSDKIKPVTVVGGAFIVGAAWTAAV